MSTRQKATSTVVPTAPTEWRRATWVVLMSALAVPPICFSLLARTSLLLPLMSLIALASAAVIALAAWCLSSNRHSAGITLWDISGVYAFIGFAAGMLSDPRQVLEF
jgi:hypothetical protein